MRRPEPRGWDKGGAFRSRCRPRLTLERAGWAAAGSLTSGAAQSHPARCGPSPNPRRRPRPSGRSRAPRRLPLRGGQGWVHRPCRPGRWTGQAGPRNQGSREAVHDPVLEHAAWDCRGRHRHSPDVASAGMSKQLSCTQCSPPAGNVALLTLDAPGATPAVPGVSLPPQAPCGTPLDPAVVPTGQGKRRAARLRPSQPPPVPPAACPRATRRASCGCRAR